ncbi:MAG: pyridoxine 5'-phosphate synthase [Candidatus Brocadiia bacterium]|jgi:pyridoxine 5-phosphate synthase|nr:pyridoxine 5'-phosphate synthase [Candidatus Brocadiia bacterium]
MNLLGVNVDHVATIREARKTYEPDPVWAAAEAQLGGADLITIHLREDRRHINHRDLRLMRETVSVELNLEMSLAEEIVGIALETGPDMVTLVPERREEVTTEGGLDVTGQAERIRAAIERFRDRGIPVSLFIDPEPSQIESAARAGAKFVELHTGSYANALEAAERDRHLEALAAGAAAGRAAGLTVNAGHGLTYNNVTPIVQRLDPHELHIGHSIIARAVFVGLRQAVRRMKEAIDRAQMFGRLGAGP